MSKELEALKEIYNGMYNKQGFIKEFKTIEQALTPPTQEEVCEAIQKEYKIEKVVYKCRTFYDEEDGQTLVIQFNCNGKLSIDFHDFIFSVDTLIKICRFYEGLEK